MTQVSIEVRRDASERLAVVVVDPIHPAGIARLRDSFDVVLPGETAGDDVLNRVRFLVVRTTEIDGSLLDRMPNLRLVAKHGSGVDNIDVPAATARGIMVANTPGGTNSTAVAEGAVTLMLAVLRRVRDMDALVRRGAFDERWSMTLGDLSGGSLGLIGFGQIARVVARICGSGFGMEVAAYDPFVSEDDMRSAGVRKVDDLVELMRQDVLSVHVPLGPKTRHLVGERELAAMSSGGIIVNTSRGGLIDEPALVRVLRGGSIRGAGIDVFEQEPPPGDHPLFELPNVVLSPHVAGVTNGSMRGMALAVTDLIDTVVAGGTPATLLNPNVSGDA